MTIIFLQSQIFTSYLLLRIECIKLRNPREPVGVETKFGWVLICSLKGEDVNDPSSRNFVNEVSSHAGHAHARFIH